MPLALISADGSRLRTKISEVIDGGSSSNLESFKDVANGLDIYLNTLYAVAYIRREDLVAHLSGVVRRENMSQAEWGAFRSRLSKLAKVTTRAGTAGHETATEVKSLLDDLLQDRLLMETEVIPRTEQLDSMLHPLGRLLYAAVLLDEEHKRDSHDATASRGSHAEDVREAAIDMITAIIRSELHWRISEPCSSVNQESSSTNSRYPDLSSVSGWLPPGGSNRP